MKSVIVALCGAGICASVAAGVWLGRDDPAGSATSTAQQTTAKVNAENTASASHASSLWNWGNPGTGKAMPPAAGKTAGTANKELDLLVARALRPAASVNGEDPREQLRKLAQDDPAVMKQLMQSYEKGSSAHVRQLVVAMLSGVDKPEVLTFAKRLASSDDIAQRKDGFMMLQNVSGDPSEVHSVILQVLTAEKTPELIMMALGALRPPAAGDNNTSEAVAQTKNAAAIVAQLQNLTTNIDPNIRIQSIMQLAQWDKAGTSQEQWSQALADQSPRVRQAAVTAVAQSGTRSDIVKAALLNLAGNHEESKDIRGNALQVLESFTLSQDEAASVSQLRSQVLGL